MHNCLLCAPHRPSDHFDGALFKVKPLIQIFRVWSWRSFWSLGSSESCAVHKVPHRHAHQAVLSPPELQSSKFRKWSGETVLEGICKKPCLDFKQSILEAYNCGRAIRNAVKFIGWHNSIKLKLCCLSILVGAEWGQRQRRRSSPEAFWPELFTAESYRGFACTLQPPNPLS